MISDDTAAQPNQEAASGLNDNSATQNVEQADATGLTRRGFLKTTAAVSAAALMSSLGQNYAHAQGNDRLRVGLIGCGGRGTGAAGDCAHAHPSVQIVALADLFQDRLNGARGSLAGQLKDQFKVNDDHTFVGWDAYQHLVKSDVDLVLMATPPGFRRITLQAAVEAGKHVFMEKPVAVDPAGVRSVIASSDLAAQKKLAVVTGTQRRHQANYIETINRIHDGAIGDVLSGQIYWNQGGLWLHERQPNWSDMEYQVRNWLYYTWLSGDHITEQHVHNIDVMNWVMNGHPVSAYAMGGRQVRTDPAYGQIYDHFAVEYEFANGARWSSQCRQQDGTDSRVAENVVGTKGTSNPSAGSIKGATNYRFEGNARNPYEQEHVDLIESIRNGKPLNEGRRIAESTLTAIIGRESAYTGKQIKWDDAMNSTLDLLPAKLEFGPAPIPEVAIPGKTQLNRTQLIGNASKA